LAGGSTSGYHAPLSEKEKCITVNAAEENKLFAKVAFKLGSKTGNLNNDMNV
jgi:hypothetical protein